MSFEAINKSKLESNRNSNPQHTSAQMNKTTASMTQVVAVAQPIYWQKEGVR